jgi:diguanylate cyclase (GGDEF)-like protein/PAS domain S-box-containing protein
MSSLENNYGRLQHFEKQLKHHDGSHVWIAENAHYKYNEQGEIIGVEGTMRDITTLKHTKKELHKEKERAHVTLSSIGDGVITTDTQGKVEYMNSVSEQGTGWKLGEARGKSIMKVLKVIDEKTLEAPPNPVELCLQQGRSAIIAGHILLIHRYINQRMSIEVNASPIRDSAGEVIGTVLVYHDVTELRGLAKKMSYQATHDSLTGLINRREFEHRINQALEIACNEGTRHTLCYMDLDNFKLVNDTCGHTAGDELLKQLTVRLRMELREADTLARLGGDEFGILLEGCSIENAMEPAEQLRKIVDEFRFIWDDKPFRVGASIGLVAITPDSGTMTDVMSAADSACYVAKEYGRNRTHIFESTDKAIVERNGQMQWVHRIQNVLEENRFRLFFQPIANLNPAHGEENRIHGEVLIRMLDENNDLVGSGAFIPSAERYGLMPAIDRWVVEHTFNMLNLDPDRIKQRMSTCSINLSGHSLSDDRFMDFLLNQIEDSGIAPSLLCFEITETAVIAKLSQASKLISRLREMGCRFALDDFGVGLSSFSYLKNLSVDYLKLDGCFVQHMMKDHIDRAMVKAINQIGHTMNIKTIAEFVEDRATLLAVRDIGVDYAQGYAVGRPTPMEIGLFGDPVRIDLSETGEDMPVRLEARKG